jgi:hypothetical protein
MLRSRVERVNHLRHLPRGTSLEPNSARPLRFCIVATFYPPDNFGGDGIFAHFERVAHGFGPHALRVVGRPIAQDVVRDVQEMAGHRDHRDLPPPARAPKAEASRLQRRGSAPRHRLSERHALENSEGRCWTTTFPTALANTTEQFKAKGD